MRRDVPVLVVEPYLVLVRLPKRSGENFDTWGTVQRVNASGPKDAILQAARDTPALTEYVPPGKMDFYAIPMRDVPLVSAVVHPKEQVEI